MKKILMVSCDGLGNGGVQSVLMSIVRNLSGKYHFDVLLFTAEKRYYDDEFLKYGKIFRMPDCFRRFDFYVRFFRLLFGTYRLIKKEKYDVIHCHKNWESGIIVLAAKLAGVKVRIVHSHMINQKDGGNIIGKSLENFYGILIRLFSTHRIGCSKKAAESLFGTKSSYRVIVNPLDLKVFYPSVQKSRQKKNLNFIHVGRFERNKNQLFLLDVFAKIREKKANTFLTMIGFEAFEKDYYPEMLKKIQQYQLEDFVRFLPSNSKIAECLKEADYMIFPSKNEGLGIVLLEAQAMGVKCFVSSGVPEEANAGLCEFYDLELGSDAWAENIIRFIEQDNGTEKANMEPYDIKNICKKYDEIYSLGGSSK